MKSKLLAFICFRFSWDYLSNNNTPMLWHQPTNTHTDTHNGNTQKHTHIRTLLLFCAHTNALRGTRVLTRCHHHSLQEAIIERKLIHSTDIPASFFPLRGLHIPGGWSVKLVDIFLVPINLWFDSLFLAVFFYCLPQTVEMRRVPYFLFFFFISLWTTNGQKINVMSGLPPALLE